MALVLRPTRILACSILAGLGSMAPSPGEALTKSSGPTAEAVLTSAERASLRSRIRAAQYQPTWQSGEAGAAYRAPNRAQLFDVAMAPDGFTAAGSGWRFRLALDSIGARRAAPVVAIPAIRAEGDVVTYCRGEGVVESFQNRPDGVEHTLVLEDAPDRAGDRIVLSFRLDTDLVPSLGADGQVLALRHPGPAGEVVARYDSLLVTDSDGRRLSAHLELPSRDTLSIAFDASAARFPITVDPLLHTQAAILHASDLQASDNFGATIALDGDTLVVGAYNEDGGAGDPAANGGAVYVFRRNQSGADVWGQVKILHSSDEQAGDLFGSSVAISGDTIVVGAYSEDGGAGNPLPNSGAVYVFQRNTGGIDNWGEVKILRSSEIQSGDSFGSSVALSGDTLVVGANGEDGGVPNAAADAGAGYVFRRNSGGADNWGEVRILRASDFQAGDQFGISVSLDGDTVVVGAPAEDGGVGNPLSTSGAAYVFRQNLGGADNWGEAKILRPSDIQANDWFGWSVSLSGGTVAIASRDEDGGAGDPKPNSGAVYLFARNTGGSENWGQTKILHASDALNGDAFGFSVALSADTLVVGAPYEDGGAGNGTPEAGALFVFSRNFGGADNWGEVQYLHSSDMAAGDQLGQSVAISGGAFAAGAVFEDGGVGNPAGDAGAAYTFQLSGGQWQPRITAHASDADPGDGFGRGVAISGEWIAVGAPLEDASFFGQPDAGTVYLLRKNAGGAEGWGEVKILRASDFQSGDQFGNSLSFSGDLLAVGAPFEDGGAGDPAGDSGAVYLFARNQGGVDNWGQVKILHASDRQSADLFGQSVSFSGDTLAVGAVYEDGGAGDPSSDSGAAYLFRRNAGGADNWGEVKILHASNPDSNDNYGGAVSLMGDILAVAAIHEDGPTNSESDIGAAYLYRRNQGGADNWGEVKILRASDRQPGDLFGNMVGLSGDLLVVGAWQEDGGAGDTKPDSGAAYVFARNAGGADNWGEVKILHASDAQTGDGFGYVVAISDVFVAVSGVSEDGGAGDPAADSGAAYVYARNAGGADNWGEISILRAPDFQAGDQLGISIAADLDRVVVGAHNEDGGPGNPKSNTGAAYLFRISAAPPTGLTNNTAIDHTACSWNGNRVNWVADPSGWNDGGVGVRSYQILRNGGVITTLAYGTTQYVDATTNLGTSYTYQVRYVNGIDGFADTPGASATDLDGTPGQPNISSGTDLSACALSGIQLTYTGGGPTRTDLVRAGTVVVTGYISGAAYINGDSNSYGYTLRAVNGTCTTDSAPWLLSDADWTPGTPTITSATDVTACSLTGIQVSFTPGVNSPQRDLYRDGSLAVSNYVSGTPYSPPDSASHNYFIRASNGFGCTPSDSATQAIADVDTTPGTPTITGYTDYSPCLSSGVQVFYTTGGGATRHDLYVGGSLAVTGYVSGAAYLPPDSSSHGYEIRAVNGACFAISSPWAITDENWTPGTPTISGFGDPSACGQTGLTINYTLGLNSTDADLRVDGALAVASFPSGGSYDPGDSLPHSYQIRAFNGFGCVADSAPVVRADADAVPPTPICQTVTVMLNGSGTASVTPAQVDNGSTDGCGGVTLGLSRTTFGCSDIGSGALSFGGVPQRVVTPGNLVHGTNFTYEAWVKPNSGTPDWEGFLATDGTTAPSFVQLNMNGAGNLRSEIYGGGLLKRYDGNVAVNDNAWHHVAITYDGTTFLLYVDGVVESSPVKQVDDPGVTVSINQPVFLGDNRLPNVQGYHGALDEVRIWNVTRSGVQIAAAKNMAVSPTSPGLIAYWRFNDGTGSPMAREWVSNLNGILTNMNPVTSWLATGAVDGAGTTLTVTDGAGNTATCNATVTVQNAAPTLPTNAGVSLTVGGGTTITNTMLAAADGCSTAAQLIYTVTSLPTEGTLYIHGGGASVSSTFPQSDIDGGFIAYGHSGGPAGPDSFGFTLSDHQGGSLPGQTFSITVTTIPPVVTAFTAPATSASLLVPITSFTATDDVSVTGYVVTESSTPPLANDPTWSSVPPASYAVGSGGSHTLYPWARDGDGNVSALYGSPQAVSVTATGTLLLYDNFVSGPTTNDNLAGRQSGTRATRTYTVVLPGNCSIEPGGYFRGNNGYSADYNFNSAAGDSTGGSHFSVRAQIDPELIGTPGDWVGLSFGATAGNRNNFPGPGGPPQILVHGDGTFDVLWNGGSLTPSSMSWAAPGDYRGTWHTFEVYARDLSDGDPYNGSGATAAFFLVDGVHVWNHVFPSPGLSTNYYGIYNYAPSYNDDLVVSKGETLPCSASTVVTSNADSGLGSLRAAVGGTCSGGTITFGAGLSGGVIRLASTLDLSTDVTIDGSSLASRVTLNGDTNSDSTGDVLPLKVEPGVTVILRSLVVTKGFGSCTDISGGVWNKGTLTLDRCLFTQNVSACGGDGGAVYNDSSAAMAAISCLFSGNSGRTGGAIYNGGSAAITNCTFVGNSATGAGYSGGAVTNNGGGLLHLRNNTFSGNSSNTGLGTSLYHWGGTPVTHMVNNILANGTGTAECSTTAGTLATSVANIVEGGGCSASLVGDPLLSAFGNYGGADQTFALLPGSPAIDAGDATTCTSAPVLGLDQRGITRPQGTGCDIGAFESRGFTFQSLTGTPQSTNVSTAFPTPLGLTVASAFAEPVDGGLVTFAAPGAGASAAIVGSPATISGGLASVTATANATAGSYAVTPSASGAASGPTFSLTNTVSNASPVANDDSGLSFAICEDGILQPLPPVPHSTEAATGYSLVYDLTIPTAVNLAGAPPAYAVDNSAKTCGFDRVGYLLELGTNWVWVSMNDFTGGRADRTGLPVAWTYDQLVSNLTVESNVAGVVTGTGIATGNIEFWPSAYFKSANGPAPGGSNGAYDFDDQRNTASVFGSMQVHNHGAGAGTVFAYNRWNVGGVGNDDLGIGNRGAADTDWTESRNAATYASRRLRVYVRTNPAPPPSILANDVDPDGPAPLTVSAFDSVSTLGAAVTVGANGDVTYDASTAQAVQALDTGESATDTFGYTAWDGGAGDAAVVSITVLGKNDAPTLKRNNLLLVGEGSLGNVIDNETLQVADADTFDGPVRRVVTVTTLPTRGTLRKGGIAVGLGGTFTEADIDVNAVTYDQSGPLGPTDTFGFSISDGDVTITGFTFAISIQPGASPPTANDDDGPSWTICADRILHAQATSPGNPDAAGYQLVYDLTLPANGAFNSAPPAYTTDWSNGICAFDRVAYRLDLGTNWIWTSMNDFTLGRADRTGVPVSWSFESNVTGLNVESNAGGVTTGTGFATGNVEFWPFVYYAAANSAIGGSSATFDFDDQNGLSGSFGSMQVHDHAAGRGTLFAWNKWNVSTGGNDDLGIGNQGSGNPDWTYGSNAASYASRRLRVYVRPLVPAPPSVLANDTDPDSVFLSVASSDATSQKGAVVAVAADGTFSYDPRAIAAFRPLDTGESTTDTFGYVVTDGFSSDTGLVTITVTGVNDPPTIATNTGTTVGRGTAGSVIAGSTLHAADVDTVDGPTVLVFTVTTLPLRGTLRKSGSALGTGGTFTQANVDAGLVTYDHAGGSDTSDSFGFSIGDGTTVVPGQTYSITVVGAAKPVPPSMTISETSGGDLRFTWALACGSPDQVIVWGPLTATGTATGASCSVGAGGTATIPAPSGDLWFEMLGRSGSRYSRTATGGSIAGVPALCPGLTTEDGPPTPPCF